MSSMQENEPEAVAGNDDELATALTWLSQGLSVARATVVKTWGSSPRPVGSQLVVNDQGQMVGSVSGGCIEGAVVHEAQQVMANGASKCLNFGVTDEQAWDVGLACGGSIEIYIEKVG